MHRGYTFYQMRYEPDVAGPADRPTGRFRSVLQVADNPGRPILYTGCLLTVLGIVVQFSMRAGVFSARGTLECKRAEVRAASQDIRPEVAVD